MWMSATSWTTGCPCARMPNALTRKGRTSVCVSLGMCLQTSPTTAHHWTQNQRVNWSRGKSPYPKPIYSALYKEKEEKYLTLRRHQSSKQKERKGLKCIEGKMWWVGCLSAPLKWQTKWTHCSVWKKQVYSVFIQKKNPQKYQKQCCYFKQKTFGFFVLFCFVLDFFYYCLINLAFK